MISKRPCAQLHAFESVENLQSSNVPLSFTVECWWLLLSGMKRFGLILSDNVILAITTCSWTGAIDSVLVQARVVGTEAIETPRRRGVLPSYPLVFSSPLLETLATASMRPSPKSHALISEDTTLLGRELPRHRLRRWPADPYSTSTPPVVESDNGFRGLWSQISADFERALTRLANEPDLFTSSL